DSGNSVPGFFWPVLFFSVFAIFVFVAFAFALCSNRGCIIRKCRKKNNGKLRKPIDLESTMPASHNIRPQTEIQNPPPDYASVTPEIPYFHGLMHEASYKAYKAAIQFTHKNPPQEVLPSQDDTEHILLSGPKGWEMIIPEERAASNNVIVSNKGRIISFHGKDDVMVQANYPHFRPQRDETSETKLMHSDNQSEQNYHKSSSLNNKTTDTWFYYFEVTILSNPNLKDTTIAVGLATKPYPNFRLPGWNDHS
ncbi:3101_t:CDS:2, partial [Dentiscutata heterogama]